MLLLTRLEAGNDGCRGLIMLEWQGRYVCSFSWYFMQLLSAVGVQQYKAVGLTCSIQKGSGALSEAIIKEHKLNWSKELAEGCLGDSLG